MVPPQCYLNFLEFYGRADLIPLRWFYSAIYCVFIVLAMLVVAQHIYYGVLFRVTWFNGWKMTAAVLVGLAAMCQGSGV
jgi:hypothetical protein